MARFTVTLSDSTTADIDGADAYQQEGPLTTFFQIGGQRQVIDSWSVRLASFRTNDIISVRRLAGKGAERAPVGAEQVSLLKSA